MIQNWKQFNESNKESSVMDTILNWIAQNISSSDIPQLIIDMSPLQESKLNENLFSDIKDKLSNWFDEKIFNYIVNKKKDFYMELIGKINIFDLTTLSDIDKNFRAFKLDSIYLAGC